MTKKEHLKTYNIELDEDLVKLTQSKGYTVEACLENYSDIVKYDWERYANNNEQIMRLLAERLIYINEIHKIDEEIDTIIESIGE